MYMYIIIIIVIIIIMSFCIFIFSIQPCTTPPTINRYRLHNQHAKFSNMSNNNYKYVSESNNIKISVWHHVSDNTMTIKTLHQRPDELCWHQSMSATSRSLISLQHNIPHLASCEHHQEHLGNKRVVGKSITPSQIVHFDDYNYNHEKTTSNYSQTSLSSHIIVCFLLDHLTCLVRSLPTQPYSTASAENSGISLSSNTMIYLTFWYWCCCWRPCGWYGCSCFFCYWIMLSIPWSQWQIRVVKADIFVTCLASVEVDVRLVVLHLNIYMISRTPWGDDLQNHPPAAHGPQGLTEYICTAELTCLSLFVISGLNILIRIFHVLYRSSS